jgi:hypothetical protein
MSRSAKPKIFLVVTIPTHLRVLMDVADLLRRTGRYEPQMVYHPSAVFDQNHANCALAPHDAFIWDETRFLSKTEYLAKPVRGQSARKEKGRIVRLKRVLKQIPDSRTYARLLKILPILPSPSELRTWGGRTWPSLVTVVRFPVVQVLIPTVRFIARSSSLVRYATSALFKASGPSVPGALDHAALSGRTWAQRRFLAAFAEEWSAALRSDDGKDTGLIGRLVRLFHEGFFSGVGEQKVFYRAFSELLALEAPDLILLPEENLFYNHHLMVHAAHLKKIPSIVVPFTIVNTLEWAESFYDVPLYGADRGLNRAVAKAFPQWVLEHRGRRLILPPVYVLGCEYLKVVPDHPWLINSGSIDAIAGESQFMCDYYLRAGLRRDKIRLTGALSDDKLFRLLQSREEQRKALAMRAGITIAGKVVLIGLPPDQFGGGQQRACEFDGYDELIRFMVGSVAKLCGNKNTLLINLHPRIKPGRVAYVEALGAKIISEPIEQLVPLSDIYVSVVSATIRLAISCGVPVVNYDAYQYNYDDYTGLPGVCEVKTKEDFERSTRALLHDDLFYSEVQAGQKETANRLCTIDGNAEARLLTLFDNLSSLGGGAHGSDTCSSIIAEST